MCGIIAGINLNKEDTKELCLMQFEDQKDRGQQGFGLVTVDKNNKVVIDRATEIVKFMMDIYTRDESHITMMHHRIPTSTKNTIKTTHPIVVDNDILKHKYLVIHNGMIRNAITLKAEHEKMGFVYQTVQTEGTASFPNKVFNDSEALAIEAAIAIDKKGNIIGVLGSAAFIVLQVDKETNEPLALYWGRNYNPLNISFNEKEILLSSTGPGEEVEAYRLFQCALKGKTVNIKSRIIEFAKEPEPIRNPIGFNTTSSYNHVYDSKTRTYVAKPESTEAKVINRIDEDDEDDGFTAYIKKEGLAQVNEDEEEDTETEEEKEYEELEEKKADNYNEMVEGINIILDQLQEDVADPSMGAYITTDDYLAFIKPVIEKYISTEQYLNNKINDLDTKFLPAGNSAEERGEYAH